MKTGKGKLNNKGMTMVEVLLGFTILLLIMGMLSGIISFAQNMYFDSVDMQNSLEEIQSAIYKKDMATASYAVKKKNSLSITPADDMPGSHAAITLDMPIYEVSGKELLGGGEDELDVNIYVIAK